MHDYVGDQRVLLLFEEIIKRESGWRPAICNTQYGCGAGQGFVGVVFSTERGCEAYFGREMDMLTARDNAMCGLHILTVKGIKKGIGHWDNFGIPLNGKQWGSGPYNLAEFGF